MYGSVDLPAGDYMVKISTMMDAGAYPFTLTIYLMSLEGSGAAPVGSVCCCDKNNLGNNFEPLLDLATNSAYNNIIKG